MIINFCLFCDKTLSFGHKGWIYPICRYGFHYESYHSLVHQFCEEFSVLFFFVHVIVIFPFIKFLLIWDSYSNGNFWNFLFESQGNNFGCCCHKVSGSWIFITTQNLKVIGGEAWFFLAYSRLCYSYFSYIWLLIYSW